MESEQPIQIDLESVVKSRVPRYSRFIPRFLISALAKAICQEQMNEMLRQCHGLHDADFCKAVLDHLNISYTVSQREAIDPSNRRVIWVCNHPLGGLDGMILIDLATRIYGHGVKFIVNDLLMAIKPLSGVFLPINKHGRQSREAFEAIDRNMESDNPIIIFPAGLCSRKNKSGDVADLQWQKNFVNKARQHHRDIIPIYFSGQNSNFFYNFAKFRQRLGIRLNIEMARLPKEVFRAKGSSFNLIIGERIPWTDLNAGSKAQETADHIRRIVYTLDRDNSTPKCHKSHPTG